MMRILEQLLQPTSALWALLWVAAAVLLRRRQYRWSLVAAVPAIALWIIGATPLPAKLLADLERPYAHLAQNPPTADAVVMLGGTHDYSPRTLLPMNFGGSVDRVTTALELIRIGKAGTLVLGGSYYQLDHERRPDSELLENWMRDWNLPTGELVRLGVCANTRDEAERVAVLVRERGWKRVLLVSSAGHLRRGEGTFRKSGIDVIPIGCDFQGMDALDHPERLWEFVPHGTQLFWFDAWLHETLGWWWYRMRGWV